MSDGALLLSAIEKAFARIGTSNGHAFPEHVLQPQGTNEQVEHQITNERVAFEFMVAGRLRTLADARYKDAKMLAEGHHLFEGIERVKPGGEGVLFNGQITNITVKVNNPTSRIDSTKLVNELRKAGVDADVVSKAVAAATVAAAPAKRITAAPVL